MRRQNDTDTAACLAIYTLLKRFEEELVVVDQVLQLLAFGVERVLNKILGLRQEARTALRLGNHEASEKCKASEKRDLHSESKGGRPSCLWYDTMYVLMWYLCAFHLLESIGLTSRTRESDSAQ